MPANSKYNHDYSKDAKVSKRICKKLTDMNVQLDDSCDSLFYTEVYAINIHTEAYNEYTQRLQAGTQNEQYYTPTPIFSGYHTAYHLCVKGESKFTNNKLSSIHIDELNILPNELMPYRLEKALLYSVSNNHRQVFKIMQDKNPIYDITFSHDTAYASLTRYMQMVPKAKTCDKDICAIRMDHARLHQVYVAIGYDCFKYCSHSKIYFNDSDIPHRLVDRLSYEVETGCFEHGTQQFAPHSHALKQPSFLSLLSGDIRRSNYYAEGMNHHLKHVFGSTQLGYIVLIMLCIASYVIGRVTRGFLGEIFDTFRANLRAARNHGMVARNVLHVDNRNIRRIDTYQG